MKTVAFVPMKLNNERLPGKNTLAFAKGAPLFHSILKSLSAVESIDEIYVFCSDQGISEELPQFAALCHRDPALDTSDTRINEVISAFSQSVAADTYVLAHATAPFLSSKSVSDMINQVNSGEYDSALSVVPVREFLWQHGQPFNYDPLLVPRTQDLEVLYAETSGAWVFGRDLACAGRRIGLRPALVEVSKIEAIDIDEPIDFTIAKAVQEALETNGL